MNRVLASPDRCFSANVLLVMFLALSLCSDSVSQTPSQGAEVEGVKFAVPAGFQLEQSENKKLSFMRNRSEPLGLFVTIAEHQVNDKYLTDLSSNLVIRLLRGEDKFTWKIVGTSEPSFSRYQTKCGTIKGLNEKTFVQVDYVVVKVHDKHIVIGSIGQFGDERTAAFLFDVNNRREYSFQGWDGLFQVISSVTGEKQ